MAPILDEEVTTTPNTGDLDYDKLVKQAETLEANTPPTPAGYDTDVDNFASQQGVTLTTDIRKLIESGMVEFLTKHFGDRDEITGLNHCPPTMEDFGFLASEWYAPSHVVHVEGGNVTITYSMYKKMDMDEKFAINVSRQLLMMPVS